MSEGTGYNKTINMIDKIKERKTNVKRKNTNLHTRI